MAIIKPTLILDLLTTIWIVTIVLVLFFWLPSKSCLVIPQYSGISQRVGNWSRLIFLMVVGVLGLSSLHFLNWLTLALLYGSCLVLNFLESYGVQSQKRFQQLYQSWLLKLVDLLDRGLSLGNLGKNIWVSWQTATQKFTDYLQTLVKHQGMLSVFTLTVVLCFALLLRWEHTLLELRFAHPDSYQTLLVTRQIMLGEHPTIDYVPVFSALAVVLSLLGSIEPMQVIRFLGPILGMVMVLSVGYSVRVLTTNVLAALVAMFSLGAYLFAWTWEIPAELPEWLQQGSNTIIYSLNASLVRQWTGSELELGAIFVMLTFAYYFDRAPAKRSSKFPTLHLLYPANKTRLDTSPGQKPQIIFWFNLGCSVAMTAISAPPLLILVLAGSIGLIGGRRLTLTTIATTWILLAGVAAVYGDRLPFAQSFLSTLPVGLSLWAGLLFLAIAELMRLLLDKWSEAFCLALIFALSFNFLLPLSPHLTYLEYDLAARKAVELTNLFPRQSWAIAAPIEQLAETYGSGWYEDLALFVELYSAKASQAEFNFPIAGKHLFIFVEKIPFVTFPNEPSVLPDSLLSDHTYRHYRSSVGRASLEFEALQMCEAYRHTHPHSKIYYEDRELRIYHFEKS